MSLWMAKGNLVFDHVVSDHMSNRAVTEREKQLLVCTDWKFLCGW